MKQNLKVSLIMLILKCVISEYSEQIVEIMNESLRSGIYPTVWKYTVVVPIPKVKNSINVVDMRPINMAPVMSKILQNIVKKQLESHIKSNNILSKFQSAFREKHSCETALKLVINNWKETMEEKKVIVAAFIDLKIAFETVVVEIMLQVLHKYGIDGVVLDWFKDWMTNRTQIVKFKNTISSARKVEIGIPQGVPLSCPLFNLYFNDIVEFVENCVLNLFADDALLWTASYSLDEAILNIQNDLNRINNFLKMCKLKINIEKTNFMIITRKAHADSTNITIDDIPIRQVNVVKYLGVMIDNRLSLKQNTEFVIKKIAKKTGFLMRNSRKMDKATKLLLYKSIVGPHLDYCSTILYLCNNSEISELQKLQNRALRAILKEDRYASIDAMLKATNLLDVKQRICYNVLILIYKAKNNLLPDYLCERLRYVRQAQPYTLRNNSYFRPLALLSASSQNSVFYNGIIMFNQMLYQNYKTNCEFSEFKREAISFVTNNYSSH